MVFCDKFISDRPNLVAKNPFLLQKIVLLLNTSFLQQNKILSLEDGFNDDIINDKLNAVAQNIFCNENIILLPNT